MATSVLTGVIDALVTGIRADAAFLNIVNVYDGPTVTAAADMDSLIVGDDDEDSDAISGEATQDWAEIGKLRRQEDGSVTCSLICQDGTTDLKARRDRSKVLLAAVENFLRTDPTFTNLVIQAAITHLRLQQKQTERGVVVHWVFTITYMARI